MLKKSSIAILSVLASMVAPATFAADNSTESQAQDTSSSESYNKWLVRGRALWVVPNSSSSSLSGVGGQGVTLTSASNALVPEIDVNYFWTQNISTELIVAATKNSLGSSAGSLGNVWLIPPTLTFLYHFMPSEMFSPYLGAGMNYTFFMQDGTGIAQSVAIDNAFGFVLQAGLDFNIDEHWSLNADVKYVFLNTTGRVNLGDGQGTRTIDITLNPWIFGVGIGYSF